MTNIIEKFNTSFGLVITVPGNKTYRVGDVVETDEGRYSVMNILMPTNRNSDKIGLLVREEKLDE